MNAFIQLGPVHATPEKFENPTVTSLIGFVLEKNSGREIKWISWRHRFRKAPFSKCFPSILRRKASVYKFLRFEQGFRKAPFSVQISVDGTPKCTNKSPFSNFFGVAWTGPWFSIVNEVTRNKRARMWSKRSMTNLQSFFVVTVDETKFIFKRKTILLSGKF